MTLNDETTEQHGHGHPRDGVPLSTRADLESVCRSATELARAAARPPCRIMLRHGQTTVEMEWPDPAAVRDDRPPPGPAVERPPAAGPSAAHAPAEPGPPLPSRMPPDPAPEPVPVPSGLAYLHAATVGTFYHAPEPGAPPFVRVGDMIRPGQQIGILEVMKMMSPVEADSAGRVVEILVPDGGSVEYRQRLIALEPVPAGGAG